MTIAEIEVLPAAVHDSDRLKALESYAILDTPPEEGFDDIVHLATQLCGAPVALVSLVAGNRQWFKARIGLEACETNLDVSICVHALGAPDLLVIPDLTRDPRTVANPLVVDAPHLRFYAGAPLRTADGVTLGTLCVVDFEARPDGLSKAQAGGLHALARQVMSQLELRRAITARDVLIRQQNAADVEREALRETQSAMSQAGGDIDTILAVLLAGAMQAVPSAEAGVVQLIDGTELEYRAVRGTVAPHRGLRVPLNGSLAGACATSNEPILVDDVMRDRRVKRDFIEQLALRSALLAPVAESGKVVGVLKLHSSQVAAFTPHDLDVARLFAGAVTAGLTEVRAATAQRAVQSSESRYRAIFESAIDFAIVATDRDGLVTNWNAGAELIFGWTAREMRGQTAERFFTPEDRATGRIDTEMRLSLENGRASDERWHLRKDGSRFWASGEMMPLRDGDTHLGFLKMLRDRTKALKEAEHVRATEKALAAAEERQRLAADATGIGIFDFYPETGLLTWDSRVRVLFGVGPEETVTYDKTFLLGVHPDDRAAADAAVQGALDPSGAGTFDIAYRVIPHSGGVERWLAARGQAFFEDGQTKRFIGTVRDITPQKVAELSLAATQERYRLALRATNDAVWDWDLANNHVRWNEALTSAYGHALDTIEPTGDWWLDHIHPSDRERVAHSIHDVIDRGGESWADHYRFRRSDGSYATVIDRGSVIRDQERRAIRMVGAMLDVSKIKASERRQAALVVLGDRLRDLTDPDEIAFAACDVLGATLGVNRVGYGVIDKVAETIKIDRDWHVSDVGSLAGTLHFREYGSYIEDLKRGVTVSVADTQTDPRTSENSLEGIGVRAFVNMPLFEHGEFVALLFATHATARPWTETDLALMREIAERVRVATERVRAETARRASEEQFRVFAQAVPNQIWVSRPDGHLDWFNDQVYTYTGMVAGGLDGTLAWSNVVHSEDRERASQSWAHSLKSGAIYETQFRIRRADGAFRWFLVRAVPVRANGVITRWVGTNTDIDENRRQAAQLAFLNEALEDEVGKRTLERDRVWNSTNDLMGTAGLDGYLKAVNPAWTRILGWSEAELLSRPFVELIDPADHGATADVVQRLAAQQNVTDFVDRVIQKDGSQRTIMWEAAPDGDLFHIVGRDITALRHTEDALRQSQKMEAVGQLTGGIAHDFNNLLTGVIGSLELVNARIAQGRFADVDRYSAAAVGAAKRAASLTHRLLAFSRRQTLDPKPTDVNRLVSGMEDLVRRSVGPQVRIEVVAAGGLWPTLIDPPQLESALLNLCINARDAMPNGGTVTIETGNVWLDRRAARERDLEPGQYISLCVSDTGTGMPAHIIAKAFDPFFTTKPIGQGTGLGLSMIYGFVRQSGGQVRIYSEVGQGTNVCLYLPRYLGTAEIKEEAPDFSDAPRARAGETVLIVDDEPTVRMLVTEVLEDLGYAAIEATDGAAGLKILQSDQRIDLVVTDVGLPDGMNGRQMVDAARAKRPKLKVLFITGFAENAVVGNGHLEPGMHVMTKPFAMDALAGRIKELIVSP